MKPSFLLDLRAMGIINAKDFVFLHNYYEPTILILYEPMQVCSIKPFASGKSSHSSSRCAIDLAWPGCPQQAHMHCVCCVSKSLAT